MQSLEKTEWIGTSSRKRYCYIDWLRIIGIISVFLAHDLRFFDGFDHQLKNNETSLIASVVFMYMYYWVMPLIFLLAGASSKFSLLTRTKKQYAAERFKRLFVPFVFGILILVPPQRYVEYLSKGNFTGTFSEFIIWYFKNLLPLGNFGFDPYWLSYVGTHIWFLGALLLFSFAGIPVFTYLESEKGESFIGQLAWVAEKPGGIFLFAIPLMVSRTVLQPIFPLYSSWCDFVFWFLTFLYGYILVSNPRFTESATHNKYLSLFIAIGSTVTILICYAMGYAGRWISYPDYSAGGVFFNAMWGIITYSMLVFFLGIGTAHLDKGNKYLPMLSEVTMPFYMLHYSIMLLIGYEVLAWEISITMKFCIIGVLTLFVTCALCYLIMRKLPWLRALFGIRPLKSAPFVSQRSSF